MTEKKVWTLKVDEEFKALIETKNEGEVCPFFGGFGQRKMRQRSPDTVFGVLYEITGLGGYEHDYH